jgi:hypothetical protein
VVLGMTLVRRAAAGMRCSVKKPAKTKQAFNELQN